MELVRELLFDCSEVLTLSSEFFKNLTFIVDVSFFSKLRFRKVSSNLVETTFKVLDYILVFALLLEA